jgi:hypothetical protein
MTRQVNNTDLKKVEHTLAINTQDGKASLVLRRKGRKFEVLSFKIAGRDDLTVAFNPKGPGVVNLDENSDVMQCFGISTKVSYGDVVLGTREMHANSLEELESALKNVKFRMFDLAEI